MTTERCRMIAGGSLDLEREERVLPDASAGQSDAGWRAYDPADVIGRDGEYDQCREYFLSDSGQVWSSPGNVVVGYCPRLLRAARREERYWENQYRMASD